jgi:hypothetical protein
MRREVHVRFCERLAVRFRGPTLPFGPHCYKKDGSWYTGASPSKKSVARLKQKVGDHLVPSQVGTWTEVRDQLNLMLKGWAAYFNYGTRRDAYEAIDHHVHDCVRHFLALHEKPTGPLILLGFGFLRLWGFSSGGKSNPAVVVAVGMWEARVFCGISKRGGNGGKVGGRTFPRFPPRVIPTAKLPEHRSRHDC